MKYSRCIVWAFLLLLMPVTAFTAQHEPDVVIAFSTDIRGNIECSG